MIIKSLTESLASNAKVAVVAVSTTISGIGTILDVIPDDIGKLATLLGVVLTTVMIYTRITHSRIERERAQLEVDILKVKLSETKTNDIEQ